MVFSFFVSFCCFVAHCLGVLAQWPCEGLGVGGLRYVEEESTDRVDGPAVGEGFVCFFFFFFFFGFSSWKLLSFLIFKLYDPISKEMTDVIAAWVTDYKANYKRRSAL
jgi:hypothetical protein